MWHGKSAVLVGVAETGGGVRHLLPSERWRLLGSEPSSGV